MTAGLAPLLAAILLLAPAAAAGAERTTRVSGDWERGWQMISEENEALAEDADLESEYLYDRGSLRLAHTFANDWNSTLEYIHENKDYRLADTYDNVGNRLHGAVTIPLGEGWKLKLSDRYWWKDYRLRPAKENRSNVAGSLLTWHPAESPWDLSLNYYYKQLDYDADAFNEYEDERVHTVVLGADYQATAQLSFNARVRKKYYAFETTAGLQLETYHLGFDYEF